MNLTWPSAMSCTLAQTMRILEAAEHEADVILWDGRNNDFSFLKPDLHIVLVDPLRPGHETSHHPGEAVLRMADVVIVAKSNSAAAVDIQRVTDTTRALAPIAKIVRGASLITLDRPDAVRGKRVIVIDDGPTLTHGGMAYGAGYVAAIEAGASEIVDPRTSAVGDIAAAFTQYPHIGKESARTRLFTEAARRSQGHHQWITSRGGCLRHAQRSFAPDPDR